jgi:hypothetical protein
MDPLRRGSRFLAKVLSGATCQEMSAAFALSGAWLLRSVPIGLCWLLAAIACLPEAAEPLDAQSCVSALTSGQSAPGDMLSCNGDSRETIRGDLHVMIGHRTDDTTYTTYELLNIERLTESRSITGRAARSIQMSAVTLRGWENFETDSLQPERVTVEGSWLPDGTFLVSALVERVAMPLPGLVGRAIETGEAVGPTWNVLVILADFSGEPPMTFPDTQMVESHLLDSSPGAVSGYTYYTEVSYGQLELQGTVTEVVIEPQPGCDQPDLTAAMIDAIEAVYDADPTVEFSDFDTIYLIAPFDCPFGNNASMEPISYPTPTGPVAVGVAWTDAVDYNKGSLLHEIGHTMSLHHSHSVDCTPESLAIDWRRLCALWSYGDNFGIMGGSRFMGHIPPIQKERLGWLSVPEVTQPGSHVLEPLGRRSTSAIRTSIDRY